MALHLAYRHFYLARCLYHILVLLSLFIFYILLYRSRESGSWATLFVPGLGQAPLGHSPIAQLVRAPH